MLPVPPLSEVVVDYAQQLENSCADGGLSETSDLDTSDDESG